MNRVSLLFFCSPPFGHWTRWTSGQTKNKNKNGFFLFPVCVVVVVVLTMSFLLSHRWDLFGKAATVSMSSCVTSKDPMPWRPYVPGSAVAIPPLNSEPSVRPGNKKSANKSGRPYISNHFKIQIDVTSRSTWRNRRLFGRVKQQTNKKKSFFLSVLLWLLRGCSPARIRCVCVGEAFLSFFFSFPDFVLCVYTQCIRVLVRRIQLISHVGCVYHSTLRVCIVGINRVASWSHTQETQRSRVLIQFRPSFQTKFVRLFSWTNRVSYYIRRLIHVINWPFLASSPFESCNHLSEGLSFCDGNAIHYDVIDFLL